jgi:hypothetical protein
MRLPLLQAIFSQQQVRSGKRYTFTFSPARIPKTRLDRKTRDSAGLFSHLYGIHNQDGKTANAGAACREPGKGAARFWLGAA